MISVAQVTLKGAGISISDKMHPGFRVASETALISATTIREFPLTKHAFVCICRLALVHVFPVIIILLGVFSTISSAISNI